MRSVLFILLALLLFGCNRKLQRRKIGENTIEARFDAENLISGHAKFYNSSNMLEFEGDFVKGIKNGVGINFYENGTVKDSMQYLNNLVHGKAYSYDSNGLLKFVSNYYYGIEMGDHEFYEKGAINEYYFENFEKVQIVNCRYDSLERCDSLVFNAKAIIRDMLSENGSPVKKIFLYFPHPPGFNVIYKLGNRKNKNEEPREITLNSNRLFLDTTLTAIETSSYYLSVDYFNKSLDSTVNVLIQKL